MIEIFYSDCQRIHVGDSFNRETALKECFETGQLTVCFKAYNGPKEIAYKTPFTNYVKATDYVANLILRFVQSNINIKAKIGAITNQSTEIFNDGKIGICSLIFQLIPE